MYGLQLLAPCLNQPTTTCWWSDCCSVFSQTHIWRPSSPSITWGWACCSIRWLEYTMSSASKNSLFWILCSSRLKVGMCQIRSGVTNWKTATFVFTAIMSTFPVVFLIYWQFFFIQLLITYFCNKMHLRFEVLAAVQWGFVSCLLLVSRLYNLSVGFDSQCDIILSYDPCPTGSGSTVGTWTSFHEVKWPRHDSSHSCMWA